MCLKYAKLVRDYTFHNVTIRKLTSSTWGSTLAPGQASRSTRALSVSSCIWWLNRIVYQIQNPPVGSSMNLPHTDLILKCSEKCWPPAKAGCMLGNGWWFGAVFPQQDGDVNSVLYTQTPAQAEQLSWQCDLSEPEQYAFALDMSDQQTCTYTCARKKNDDRCTLCICRQTNESHRMSQHWWEQ